MLEASSHRRDSFSARTVQTCVHLFTDNQYSGAANTGMHDNAVYHISFTKALRDAGVVLWIMWKNTYVTLNEVTLLNADCL